MSSEPNWDHYSDQPYKLSAAERGRIDADTALEYFKTLATGVALTPALLLRYFTLTPRVDVDSDKFVGLSISPRSEWATVQQELVEELGVRNLLLRVPSWHANQLGQYAKVLERYPEHRFIINILQQRDSVERPLEWLRQVDSVLAQLPHNVTAIQFANAINRKKWGCRHTGDYLRLQRSVDELRGDYPQYRFLGSSVIDFEPLSTLRSLFNFHRFRLDGVASQLYVNRRGSPYNRQLGLFDLQRKIRLLATMASLGNRTESELWITETNWPLLNTRPFTPNSGHPRSTVDEATQATYLTDYYKIAWHSRQVQAVYWWQLISPGYGLIDHRGGDFRKMPSFEAFKRVVAGNYRDMD